VRADPVVEPVETVPVPTAALMAAGVPMVTENAPGALTVVRMSSFLFRSRMTHIRPASVFTVEL
jgi:hypothetical protein